MCLKFYVNVEITVLFSNKTSCYRYSLQFSHGGMTKEYPQHLNNLINQEKIVHINHEKISLI